VSFLQSVSAYWQPLLHALDSNATDCAASISTASSIDDKGTLPASGSELNGRQAQFLKIRKLAKRVGPDNFRLAMTAGSEFCSPLLDTRAWDSKGKGYTRQQVLKSCACQQDRFLERNVGIGEKALQLFVCQFMQSQKIRSRHCNDPHSVVTEVANALSYVGETIVPPCRSPRILDLPRVDVAGIVPSGDQD